MPNGGIYGKSDLYHHFVLQNGGTNQHILFLPLPKFCPNIIPYKQKFCSKFMVYNLFTSDILFFNLKVNYMQH